MVDYERFTPISQDESSVSRDESSLIHLTGLDGELI